jgi:endonuclease/exonuclease/phosphatase family metal-dependent hydrolase
VTDASSGAGPIVGPIEPPALHVMTFNVRRPVGRLAWRRADRWPQRRPRLRALLAAERPTVLCLQEAVPHQVAEVLAALGPGHRFVGHGRGPRRTGEGCPIVFDAGRLELLAWRQHALSADPDRDGSRSWGNVIPRIAVSAHFRDRSTGARFDVLNTHLDPFSARSRVRSVAYLRSLVGPGPTIVAGDLNAGGASRTVRDLLADGRPAGGRLAGGGLAGGGLAGGRVADPCLVGGGLADDRLADSRLVGGRLVGGRLVDTWTAARSRLTPRGGTFAGYRTPRPNGPRLDWILASEGVVVDHAAINARRFAGGWPSDHLPVQAVVRIVEAEAA